MKIIVDGFGGDNAPLSVLQGCALAVAEYDDVEIIVTGDEANIRKVAAENNISLDKIEIVDANGVIDIEDEPTDILKAKKDCSMAVAFQLLAQGKGDAFVSGGSTGAIVVGASFLVKRIKGIKRAALAPILPTDTGCYMLMDAGANLDCRPEMLMQFGIMGSVYMNKIIKVDSPRVGLLNVGAEETKGTDLQLGAYHLLKQSKLNFCGNVEPRDVPAGVCDVLVTDGFSGNVVLKLTEGLGMTLIGNIKDIFMKGFFSKIAAAIVLPEMKKFKKKMDYTEYGGAPLMGISKPVIKAHGSSNAKAFKNAIRQARDFAQMNVIEEIKTALSEAPKAEEQASE